jgi:hypothetical protein
LGIVAEYVCHMQGDDGRVLVAGRIIEQGKQGFLLGSVLAWPAERWRLAE